jgi:hypothetical protein
MTDAESECWASAQRWHEKCIQAEAEIARLRARIDTLIVEREAERKTYNDAIADLIADNKRLKP